MEFWPAVWPAERNVHMTMNELVHAARSVRRFDESQPIPEDVLVGLVDLARVCPCGANQQKLRYRIVSGADECARLFPSLAWAGALQDWPGPAEGERPTGYILVLGNGMAEANTGIAAQTIQLAAREMGYGACMLGAIQRGVIKKTLAIPDPYKVNLAMALGTPAETVVLDEVAEGDSLEYYRDAKDVHHVPKLRLQDVLLQRR